MYQTDSSHNIESHKRTGTCSQEDIVTSNATTRQLFPKNHSIEIICEDENTHSNTAAT